jgi:hypothetical protein
MILAPILALAGCWEKIEYTGSAPSSKSEHASPSDSAATATLPETKKTELPPTSVAQTPAPSASQNSASPASGDDRYPTTTSPPPSLAESATLIPPKPLKHDADGDRYAIAHPPIEASPITQPAPQEAGPVSKTEEKPQPPERHTDATSTSATIEVKPAALNTRRTAWHLGDRLSFAALAHDRGLAPQSVPKWFDEAQMAAKSLGTSVDGLPEAASSGDTAAASQQVIDYLIAQGRHAGGEIAQKHGRETAALFEVALKSNILLLLYTPNSTATNSIAAAISRAAPQGGLPRELWTPLLETLNKQASLDEVRTAVRKMHAVVDQYLATAAEQKPK